MKGPMMRAAPPTMMQSSPTFDVRSLAGVSAPLGFFDPLGFTTGASEGRVKFLRECEIKHSRVAMLAALGFVAGEFVPGSVPSVVAFQESGVPASAFILLVGLPEIFSIFTFNSPFGGEIFSIRKDYANGNFDFDPLGLKPTDKAALKEMQTKELNNGRLAMIAWAGMASQELVHNSKLF